MGTIFVFLQKTLLCGTVVFIISTPLLIFPKTSWEFILLYLTYLTFAGAVSFLTFNIPISK
ncbi:hypothetical protein FD00_GL001185 [Liquorilactobacillus mali KCTC 3596 = DSM 20444]|uniref:Uncharacterized protein n=1 Tax=Liquorilactobacillus mali KCTC 3596 = DSM 20444 TaxID=1046596 RepID=A0A0R2EB80_9LACO|nr:hypothetical protein FD00_GL001185 [Liquorilactobacillus mali KCTC 3596 = DSM 20444]